MVCEACLEPVQECACCAGGPGACACGFPICSRCAEAFCAEDEEAAPVAVGGRW